MEVITLQSGSAGNCVFVRSGETRLLFDVGISGSNAESRLAKYGYDIRDCNASVLSHEHYDHISGVGAFHRRFGLPVYSNLRICELASSAPGCIQMFLTPAAIAYWMTSRVTWGGVTIDRDSGTTGRSAIQA